MGGEHTEGPQTRRARLRKKGPVTEAVAFPLLHWTRRTWERVTFCS